MQLQSLWRWGKLIAYFPMVRIFFEVHVVWSFSTPHDDLVLMAESLEELKGKWMGRLLWKCCRNQQSQHQLSSSEISNVGEATTSNFPSSVFQDRIEAIYCGTCNLWRCIVSLVAWKLTTIFVYMACTSHLPYARPQKGDESIEF